MPGLRHRTGAGRHPDPGSRLLHASESQIALLFIARAVLFYFVDEEKGRAEAAYLDRD